MLFTAVNSSAVISANAYSRRDGELRLVSFCASSSGGIELPLSILAGGEELLALIPLGCAETLPFGMPGGAACSCAAAVFLLLSVFKHLPPE